MEREAQHVVVVGDGGVILKTSNGGASWVQLVSGTTQNLFGVHFPVDAAVGFAVGKGGVIRRTVDGGTSWTGQVLGFELRAVHFPVDATIGYAVGVAGVVFKTTDGGATWLAQGSLTGGVLHGVHFLSATHGFAVGDSGTGTNDWVLVLETAALTPHPTGCASSPAQTTPPAKQSDLDDFFRPPAEYADDFAGRH